MDFEGVRVPQNSVVVRGIAQGAVTAGKTVTVSFAGNSVVCLAARDLTTATGDVVIGLREPGQITIIARLCAAAPSAPDSGTGIPAPESYSVSGDLVVYPVETRSYRSGGWRTDMDDLLQGEWGGNIYTGCAFYGTTPLSLSGATVTTATIMMKRIAGGSSSSSTPTLWQITESTKPTGAPTRGSSITGPDLSVNEANTFTIPTAWGQALVDGTVGGLGIYVPSSGDPHVRLAGRDVYSPSMVLTLSWTRIT
jgi:hypothetical protein